MTNLDLDQLKLVLATLAEGDVSEFEYEDDKIRIRIGRGARVVHAEAAAPGPAMGSFPPPPSLHVGASPVAVPEDDSLYVTCPFVGTFYRAPSPDAPNFVEVGTTIREGQTLCIVEAMKLFNELEAEFPCVIEACLLDNAQPVEYGAKLFRVRKL